MQRVVAPELLDELAPDDARARRSRRDLVRVNAWMGNARCMSRLVQEHGAAQTIRRVVELGAGDGTFMLNIARRLGSPRTPVEVWLVDRQELVTQETLAGFANVGWTAQALCADVFEWFATGVREPIDLVLANLFLHHFTDEPLRQLFHRVAATAKVFAACEPRRSARARIACRSLWLLGCNAVTRHDAAISVRAGFRGQELSALWPEKEGWQLVEQANGLFTHCFVAKRVKEELE